MTSSSTPAPYVARYWRGLDDGRIECRLCPRHCRLGDGQRAFCFVRQNQGGQLVLTTYGRSSGFCIDPIEKKPLNHFYPGTSVLSFGTAGCNLGCKFCQNHDISKAREFDRLQSDAGPRAIADAAAARGCRSVAFTYNDPVIFAEYAIDTAHACRERGVASVAVTAGYITELARAEFFAPMDAVNVDLKALTDDFYYKLTYARLQPVLDTIEYLATETDVWVELTTLLIPGHNDSEAEVANLCRWIYDRVGPDVPLHFSAFHPDFKMRDVARTPAQTLSRARRQALETGLRYVYTGNVSDPAGQSTYCGACSARVIERDWYRIGEFGVVRGACSSCGAPLPGRFDDAPGGWGQRRLPIAID